MKQSVFSVPWSMVCGRQGREGGGAGEEGKGKRKMKNYHHQKGLFEWILHGTLGWSCEDARALGRASRHSLTAVGRWKFESNNQPFLSPVV